MSSFNWFNRRYDDAEDESSESASASSGQNPESETSEDTADSAQPTSAEDYLQWAKAAYQNIQQQQSGDDSAIKEDAKEDTSEEETQPRQAQELEPVTPDGSSEALEDGESSSEEPTAAVEAATPDTTDAAPEAVISDELASETVLESETSADDTATPQPFWAQAQTEREERLERLKETAISEEPEPVAASEPVSEPELELPDINFDEAFVWSAEVLASQGRRPDQISAEEITWLNRLRQGLDKTRRGLVNQLKSIVGQGPLNEEAVYEIEALLLQADVGVEATDFIIDALQTRLRDEVLPPEQAIQYLKSLLRSMLDTPLGDNHNLLFVPEPETLNIWLMTGVNGAGKTTTIGKLTHIAKKSGYKCLIAAADTFRAAAVEQVKVWGQRSGVEVISNPGQNTDPAAVVFDGITAAQSRGTELLLVDTAGRLQNKKNLMDELAKIRRIVDKKAPDAKVESLLVLDATLGQNGIRQAKVFSEAADLSGVVLTKLDGTAKGGVALAVVQQLGLPIRFIGAGEGIEDLRPFSSYEFVEALLSG